jgi:hypothetical protein
MEYMVTSIQTKEAIRAKEKLRMSTRMLIPRFAMISKREYSMTSPP